MSLLSKAPNVVVVCTTVVLTVSLGCITLLLAIGKDPHQVMSFIGLLLNGAGVLLGSGAFLYAGAAAKASDQTNNTLNGNLDSRISSAVQDHINASHTIGGPNVS